MNNIIYGIHPICIILKNNSQSVLSVFLLKKNNNRLNLLIEKIKTLKIPIHTIHPEWLDKKILKEVHQGIIALVKKNKEYKEHDLPILISQQKNPLFLILDRITDPHNLGACLRCADAAGVHAVITTYDRSASLTPIVKKISSGSSEVIPFIRVTNLVRTMLVLKKYNLYIVGTSEKANHNIYQTKLIGPLALVMGGENKGMRRLTKEYCDQIVSIPMMGVVSSLNVSVAAGICLFEAFRQRNKL